MNNANDILIVDTDLPKVMIIGQTFTTDTGGGITLSSLFKNWPKNKLAVAVESKETLDFSKASNYYRLGFQEQAMPFPFSMFQRKTKSGRVTEAVVQGAVHVKETTTLKATLKRNLDNTLHHLGLFYWLYGNQKLSNDFIDWFNDFNPDIIYYQPNSYKSFGFVTALKGITKKPLVIHVMDDWFTFAVKNSPLKTYWERKFDQKVRLLFSLAQVHLSICQYMADAYLQRYGYQFYPYHNSVDLDFWTHTNLKIKVDDSPFRLLYAGRVGYGVENTLQSVANAVETMASEGLPIQLEIQTKDANHPLIATLRKLGHTIISETIPYKQLPDKFASADALLIPCDFDEMGLKFIKYSMPTKVSEYMAVGTPVFVVGPPQTALVEYARQGWAHICTSIDAVAIKSALAELVNSLDLRNGLVKSAGALARQNHDEKEIIKQFRSMMYAAAHNRPVSEVSVNA
ncbi:glycosyltransferase family 4 protein [Mucilaginibacter lacusdianchii]|uniref:glycosyltransferase family 4 protein n=1 Tax=Mucilaginibacter lacusdianchii TaxID=2684211 RepID=UPI00131D3014|nr:glycosyltransferase family 4 protein [Mucilaginibacter sp. JXJ CY 39]